MNADLHGAGRPRPVGHERTAGDRRLHTWASAAFTLVELLVVIGIIAILAAIVLPAMMGGLRKADSARALHETVQIASAVKAFYSEYGKMPAPTGDPQGSADYTYGSKSATRKQNLVIRILRGVDTTNNPHRISFLDVPDKSMAGTDKDGNAYVMTESYFLDPWEDPYIIALNCGFDNTLDVSGAGTPAQTYIEGLGYGSGGTFDAKTVGVFSYGGEWQSTNAFLVTW